MEENQTATTTVPEGVSQGSESQVSAPTSQDAGQGQNGNAAQVERSEAGNSSQEETRRASDGWQSRKIGRMEKQIGQMMQMLQSSQQQQQRSQPVPSQGPSTPGFDPNEFFSRPEAVLNRLLDEREQRLRGEIPKSLEQFDQQRQFESSRQEALRLINTNEFVKKDPVGYDKVRDILEDEEFGLDKISEKFPLQAAKLALEVYNLRHSGQVRRGPNVPSRGQMQSTATAVNSTGSKPGLQAEYQALLQEMTTNPMAAYDPAFQEKLNALKQRRASETIK